MSQTSQDYDYTSGEKQLFRPTRVAIVHGSSLSEARISNDEIHDLLVQFFVPLNIRVFSVTEMSKAGMSDLLSSPAYDIVGLMGEAGEFPLRRKRRSTGQDESNSSSLVVSFAPKNRFGDSKKYLDCSDALVLCDAIKKNWLEEVSKVVYGFFESLLIPSMLNIDVADVKRIATGIGLAFNIEDDDPRRIIAELPNDCLVASAALLHFSCSDDVRLKEIYSVSKSIAMKKGQANVDPIIESHSDAEKLIRKVNVKMGIRVIDSDDKEEEEEEEGGSKNSVHKRIRMTAILFGI